MKFGLLIVGEKGKEVLFSLVKANIIPEFVVTYYDKNVDISSYSNITSLCSEKEIKFLSTREDVIYSLFDEVDKVFVIGWQFLLTKHLNKLIVIHDSYLPEYKGWSPTVNYLIEGSNYLAATAFEPTEIMDTGDIYAQKKRDITYPMKIETAFKIVSELYFEIIVLILNGAEKKKMIGKESFCLWRDKQDYIINWSWSGEKIVRFIDAVGYPYDGAKFISGDQEYEVSNGVFEELRIIDEATHYGKILKYENEMPCVVCRGGVVKLQMAKYSRFKLKSRL